MRSYPGEGQVRIAHGEERDAFQENTRQMRKSKGGEGLEAGLGFSLVSFNTTCGGTQMCPNPSLGVKDYWDAAFRCSSLSAPTDDLPR